MSFISPENLLKAQDFRYAAKKFDPNRAISETVWRTLEECLRSTPSSYNLQPWKFIIVKSEVLKARLRPHAFNQPQIEDCSHLVIFCAKESFDEAWIEKLVAYTANVRGVSPALLNSYSEIVKADVLAQRKGQSLEIGIRHCFLAMGNLLTSAALLGVDSCPIEGFIPKEFDDALSLTGTGWKSCLCCALGYRAAQDKYGTFPKVRFRLPDIMDIRDEES